MAPFVCSELASRERKKGQHMMRMIRVTVRKIVQLQQEIGIG